MLAGQLVKTHPPVGTGSAESTSWRGILIQYRTFLATAPEDEIKHLGLLKDAEESA
jgi:hypothetical protein